MSAKESELKIAHIRKMIEFTIIIVVGLEEKADRNKYTS